MPRVVHNSCGLGPEILATDTGGDIGSLHANKPEIFQPDFQLVLRDLGDIPSGSLRLTTLQRDLKLSSQRKVFQKRKEAKIVLPLISSFAARYPTYIQLPVILLVVQPSPMLRLKPPTRCWVSAAIAVGYQPLPIHGMA